MIIHVNNNVCTNYLLFYFQLSFSPNIPVSSHLKVVALLSGVLVCCGILLMVCTVVGWQFGISYFSFLSSEVRMHVHMYIELLNRLIVLLLLQCKLLLVLYCSCVLYVRS